MVDISARIIAATVGGYALTIVASVSLANVLPMPRSDAVLTAILLSFAFHAGTILWSFSARTLQRAWLGLLSATALFACLAWLTRPAGAP